MNIIPRLLILFIISCSEYNLNIDGNQSKGKVSDESDREFISSNIVNEIGNCNFEYKNSTPETSSGNLKFKISNQVDPCSVRVLLVGGQDEIHPVKVQGGSYLVTDLPEGSLDMIITASRKLSNLSKEILGNRIDGIEIDSEKNLSELDVNLRPVNDLEGRVTLSDHDDFSGVRIFIPGTNIEAFSDSAGFFKLAPFVVNGTHSLYFEKDGYKSGQIENILVENLKIVKIPEIQLVPLNSSKQLNQSGFILVQNGSDIHDDSYVEITLGYNEKAKEMIISEHPGFEDAQWEPVLTSTQYQFDEGGLKTLYLKFRNSDGIESAVFSDQIDIKLSEKFEGKIEVSEGAYTSENSIHLNIEIPKTAVEMLVCLRNNFSGCVWEKVSSKKNLYIPQDGKYTIFTKYRSKSGKESPIYSTNVIVDTSAPVFNLQVFFDGYSDSFTLNISDSDLVGVDMMKINGHPDHSSDQWVGFENSFDLKYYKDLTLHVQLVDHIGHKSKIKSIDIRYDIASIGVGHIGLYNYTNSWIGSGHVLSRKMDDLLYYMRHPFYNSDNRENFVVFDQKSNTWDKLKFPKINNGDVKYQINRNTLFLFEESDLLWPGNASDNVDFYQCEDNNVNCQWYEAKMSERKNNLSFGKVGRKTLVAGGIINDPSKNISNVNSDSVDVFDCSEIPCSHSVEKLSLARRLMSTAEVNNRAIFAGGQTDNSHRTNRVDIYDCSGETCIWNVDNLQTSRSAMSVARLGNKAIFAGGLLTYRSGEPFISNTVDIFDCGVETCHHVVASLSEPRYSMATTELNEKAYFAGGYRHDGNSQESIEPSKRVDIYNCSGTFCFWQTEELSIARVVSTAISIGNKVFFAGGYESSLKNPVFSRIDIYDDLSESWSTYEFPIPCESVNSEKYDGKIIFLGCNHGLIYDSHSDTWSETM